LGIRADTEYLTEKYNHNYSIHYSMVDTNTEVNFDSTFHTVTARPDVIGKYEILQEVG
jgi:hypothetical protein